MLDLWQVRGNPWLVAPLCSGTTPLGYEAKIIMYITTMTFIAATVARLRSMVGKHDGVREVTGKIGIISPFTVQRMAQRNRRRNRAATIVKTKCVKVKEKVYDTQAIGGRRGDPRHQGGMA